MTMLFKRETLDTAFNDAIPLLMAHYEEIAWNKDKIPLDINFEAYLKLEKAGILIVFTARQGFDLAGYSVFFVNTSPHYNSTKYAINDVIFVKPEFRGTTGLKFAKFCEAELKTMSVKVITYHIKDKFDWSPALVRIGYEKMESILSKWIGD